MTSNGHHRLPASAFAEMVSLLETDREYRRLQAKADDQLAKAIRIELRAKNRGGSAAVLMAATIAAAFAAEKRERRRRELLNLLGQGV